MGANQKTSQVGAFTDVNVVAKDRISLVENFDYLPAVNGDTVFKYSVTWELSGTNATSGTSAVFFDNGGVRLLTAGAAADQAVLQPHVDTQYSRWANTKWNTGDEVSFKARIKTGSAVTAQYIWFGLFADPDAATFDPGADANQAAIYYDAANSAGLYWKTATNVDSVDVTTNSDLLVEADTVYDLEVRVNAERIPHYYVNGQIIGQGPALKADTDLIPGIGIESTATAAKTMYVFRLEAGKKTNN